MTQQARAETGMWWFPKIGGPQNIMILIIGTSKKGYPDFRKPHVSGYEI